MRILHTADLHLGQIIYQYYDREDEHLHYFNQLARWCVTEQPDALVISGDIFDTAQPTVAARRFFAGQMMRLRRQLPDMPVVVIAGNHDSAGRLEAEAAVWSYAGIHTIGTAPAQDTDLLPVGWQSKHVIEIPAKGYIVAVPFYSGSRKTVIQSLLDYVAERNTDNLPVVQLAHQWVQGMAGWGSETGNLAEKSMEEFGQGYDYLALGHIHKPHTLGQKEDIFLNDRTQILPAPVARYSGSALHVSASERVPHSVSVVDMDRHNGDVCVRPLRISQLRHFYTLPESGSAIETEEQLRQTVQAFVDDPGKKGYFRLRVKTSMCWENDPDKLVEQIIAGHEDKARYNPQTLYEGTTADDQPTGQPTGFEVEDFQQMTDPLEFIRKSIDRFPAINPDSLEDDFRLISERVRLMDETTNNSRQA